jgi:hypothetical protein
VAPSQWRIFSSPSLTSWRCGLPGEQRRLNKAAARWGWAGAGKRGCHACGERRCRSLQTHLFPPTSSQPGSMTSSDVPLPPKRLGVRSCSPSPVTAGVLPERRNSLPRQGGVALMAGDDRTRQVHPLSYPLPSQYLFLYALSAWQCILDSVWQWHLGVQRRHLGVVSARKHAAGCKASLI